MRLIHFLAIVALPALALSGCSMAGMPAFKKAPVLASLARPAPVAPKAEPEAVPAPDQSLLLAFAEPTRPSGGSQNVNGLISKYSALYGVPESLVHRMVKKESTYNPSARNGAYYGLMQISQPTAQSMGYQGKAAGLLDADINLKYAVKYLAGAYKVSGGDHDQAMRLYQRGYYYDAKRKGLLDEVGLR